MRGRLIRLVLCAWLVGAGPVWALAPHDKAVGVQAERHAENGVQPEQNAGAQPSKAPQTPSTIPSIHAPGGNGEGQAKGQEGAEEGTEFWPPFHGYRFKITDSIVAVFTALLFLATLALWWATKRLVRGADQTAVRQLRAYIGIEGVETRVHPNQIELIYYVKNYGQTPAHMVVFICDGQINEGFCDKTYADPDGIGVGVVHWPGHVKRITQRIERVATKGSTTEHYITVSDRIEIQYVDAFGEQRNSIFRHERTAYGLHVSIVKQAEAS